MQWLAIGSWQQPAESNHWSWSSYNYMRSCWRTQHWPCYLWSLGIWSKLQRWKSSISIGLWNWPKRKQTNKQSLVWRVVFSSCSVQQQLGISWTDHFVQCKVDFRWQPVSSSSVAGRRRSSKIPPKVKNAPENDHGHCLVVCFPSDPPQFSESWWNYYIWEVCSTNWWDALKTAMPAVGIGQPQNGPKSSPWQCPVACCTTSASEVERIGQWSFDSSVGFTWPLANRLPLL